MRKIALSTSVTLMVVGLTTRNAFPSRAEAEWGQYNGNQFYYAHQCESGWLLDYHIECDRSSRDNCSPVKCSTDEDPAPC